MDVFMSGAATNEPVAVWPKDAALQKFVFPRPRG